VQATHLKKKEWDLNKEVKYTDSRRDEVDRKISIKSSPVTLILPDSRSKSYLFNFIDTPGHPNFADEVSAGFRLSDSVLLVVDCVEGVTFYTERLIKEALKAKMQMIVVLNKLDRLILELKLPLNDAYHKIKHTLEEINFTIRSYPFKPSEGGEWPQISPSIGNVVFASTQFGCLFTLQSFARRYMDIYAPSGAAYSKQSQDLKKNNNMDPERFAQFLWGDLFYDEDSRKFARKANTPDMVRSFVFFILEPFYKLVGYAISTEKPELAPVLKKLGIFLKKKDYQLDIKPLLKLILTKAFGDMSCLIDAITKHTVDAKGGTRNKVLNYYTGDLSDEIA